MKYGQENHGDCEGGNPLSLATRDQVSFLLAWMWIGYDSTGLLALLGSPETLFELANPLSL